MYILHCFLHDMNVNDHVYPPLLQAVFLQSDDFCGGNHLARFDYVKSFLPLQEISWERAVAEHTDL